MIKKSDFSKSELISRWDEYTSPARFAGSDDLLDDIFIGKRKGDKVYLSIRPRLLKDPFATVFRGKIVETETGSAIKGMFTVGVFDYIVSVVFAFLISYVLYELYRKNGSISEFYAGEGLLCGIIFLLLYPKRSPKKRYTALISKITDKK